MTKEQKTLLISIIISVLLHIGFIWLIDFKDWLSGSDNSREESVPQELTFIFPENKPDNQPREVVQNINENEQIPEQSNLLSDRNSQARNPVKTDQTGDSPFSKGNTPFSNLSGPTSQRSAAFQQKKFSREALKGDTYKQPRSEKQESQDGARQSVQSQESYGSNQVMNQEKFSVEELGAISLSTYRWNWAPYINSMKNKLQHVWVTPPAYNRLGLVHGYTIINFTISREGELLKMKVLHHEGHQSLEFSSSEAIKALFPFLPLPEDFPEETLTIIAKLYYPDLRRGR